MGLNDNTKNIELAITEKNRIEKEKEIERRRKEAERKKKQEEKENLQRLTEDIKEYIKAHFEEYLNKYGIDYIIEFYSVENKNKLKNKAIKEFRTLETFKNEKGLTIKEFYNNEKEIATIFDNNYYKILKQQENIYKMNDKYLYQKQLDEAEQQPKKKKPIDWCKVIKYSFLAIAFIVFSPIAFVCLLVLGVCKNSK